MPDTADMDPNMVPGEFWALSGSRRSAKSAPEHPKRDTKKAPERPWRLLGGRAKSDQEPLKSVQKEL